MRNYLVGKIENIPVEYLILTTIKKKTSGPPYLLFRAGKISITRRKEYPRARGSNVIELLVPEVPKSGRICYRTSRK